MLEFILNSNSKSKNRLFTFLSVHISWIKETKSLFHSFYLQNFAILQTRLDQSGDYMKMNFHNFQMEKWFS